MKTDPGVNTALANDAAEMRKATLSTLLADPARGRGSSGRWKICGLTCHASLSPQR